MEMSHPFFRDIFRNPTDDSVIYSGNSASLIPWNIPERAGANYFAEHMRLRLFFPEYLCKISVETTLATDKEMWWSNLTLFYLNLFAKLMDKI